MYPKPLKTPPRENGRNWKVSRDGRTIYGSIRSREVCHIRRNGRGISWRNRNSIGSVRINHDNWRIIDWKYCPKSTGHCTPVLDSKPNLCDLYQPQFELN